MIAIVDEGGRLRTGGRKGESGGGASTRRLAALAGAGALAYYGYRRRDLAGLGLGVMAGVLAERAVDAAGNGGLAVRQQHGRAAVLDASTATKVERTMTIAMPRDQLYRFWRNFENLPRIMKHLESVTVLDERRSRWTAKAPAGTTVQWDAEIHHEIENELIAWRSIGEATVPNAGSVHFREAGGGRGTELKVVLEYAPPAGRLGTAVAKLFGEEPGAQVLEDLRRFKRVMETGEIATTEGQPACR